LAALTVGVIGWLAATPVQAQQSPGSICISTFADVNANGLREETETALAGVNVNLSTAGAIIATHITTGDADGYCFENLLAGNYTVTFTDSLTYHATTSNEGTFNLEAGQRLTINSFGANPVDPAQLRAEFAALAAAAQDDDQLEPSTRLLLATGGSMVVMIFMVGLGAMVLGMMSQRARGKRRKPPGLPPPPRIQPPGRG
jgi:hypothetical protein